MWHKDVKASGIHIQDQKNAVIGIPVAHLFRFVYRFGIFLNGEIIIHIGHDAHIDACVMGIGYLRSQLVELIDFRSAKLSVIIPDIFGIGSQCGCFHA